MSQNMQLSMTPYTQAGAFVCSQYDVGRECQITLVDDSGNYTIPTGATITVMATKPSGLGFTETCTWTGSTVTFSTTNTMTNEFGRFPAELRITQGNTILGTTNFYFKVEKSPHPNDVIDDDVIIHQNLVARVTTLEGQMATVQSDLTDVMADIGDLANLETTDKSSLVGAINEARGTGGSGSGLTADIKTALLQIAQKVAYIDDDGQTYYNDLYDALYAITAIALNTNSISMQSIGATSQLTATTTPAGGSVTWSSSNTSIATVSSTGLVTSVAYGSATITASAGSVSATCSVVVAQPTCTGITATYTQSGTVYDTASLSDLTSDLVVVANYSDSTTATLTSSDYTLSGTLAEGTSTITVSYGGQTTTFSVTVTHEEVVLYALPDLDNVQVSSSIWVSVSDGNHIYAKTTSNSRGPYIFADGTAATSFNNVRGVLFTIPANATWEVRVKNISWQNATSGEANSFSVELRNSSGTAVVSANDIPLTTAATGTREDVTVSGTVGASDETIYSLFVWIYRPVELSFDYELYVNGARWL